MFADLMNNVLPGGCKTTRYSICSPVSLKEKFIDNKLYKNEYLQLRPKETMDTESTNIYSTRMKNLESDLRELEIQ